MNKGLWYGIGVYAIWGVLPVYWKAVHTVPAAQIVSHRTVWSLVFVLALLTIKKQWGWLKPALKDGKTLLTVLVIGTLLATNWLIYIWAVNAGYVVETSLGYFINPLVNVLLGMLFLKETLRAGQWLAVGMAAAGPGRSASG